MTDDNQENTGQDSPGSQPPLPTINFATFIFSLNSSALVQLGMMEDPMTGEKSKNLPLAKQTIDLLSMLEEKTQGNLTDEEAATLTSVLHELRMAFVHVSTSAGQPPE